MEPCFISKSSEEDANYHKTARNKRRVDLSSLVKLMMSESRWKKFEIANNECV